GVDGSTYASFPYKVPADGTTGTIIKKFSPSGSPVLTIDSPGNNLGYLSVAANGSIYASGYQFPRPLLKFSPNGSLLWTRLINVAQISDGELYADPSEKF